MAIIQEALTNALRHSGCSAVEIRFSGKKNFRVTVTDDGSGFENHLKEGGYGLQNMKQRAVESGFLLDISTTEKGTVVTIGNADTLS